MENDSSTWRDAYNAYKSGTPINRVAKDFGIGVYRLTEYVGVTEYLEQLGAGQVELF